MKEFNFLDELFTEQNQLKNNSKKNYLNLKSEQVDFYNMFDIKQFPKDTSNSIITNTMLINKELSSGLANGYNYINYNNINPKQIEYIKRHEKRRQYLDQFMLKKSEGYTHESRHKHAMNRLRAPSGRFLTKEETKKIFKKSDDYS